jgi:hypothetical protein
MTFDALTITGIVWSALSGGFVLATAFAQAARRSAHLQPSSRPLTTRLAKRGAPGVVWPHYFRPLKDMLIKCHPGV